MENWTIWLIAAVILFIVEMVTPTAFFFACFGVGALATSVLSYFALPLWVMWASFFGFSTVLVLLARPIAAKLMKGESRPSNVDELLGKEAIVMEAIAPHKSGLVKVKNEVWKAESADVVSADAIVEVLRVEGTHLVVKKKEGQL